MFYLFHGEDGFSRDATVAQLRERLFASDPVAELNYAELDGRRLGLGELRAAVEALPFLGERRMVVVRDLCARLAGRGGENEARKAFLRGLTDLLAELPPSTRLVLVEGVLTPAHPLLRWAKQWRESQPDPEAAAMIRAFEPPKPEALAPWLARRAGARGASLEPAALAALAEALVHEGKVDLRLADSELEKLLTYAGGEPVRVEDVAAVVSAVQLDTVFALIDALAERQGPAAATLLTRFLDDGEPPLRLLALIVRQFRLIALGQACLEAGLPPAELPGRLGVPPFVARKVGAQARRFSPGFIQSALGRLIEIDTEIKTGRIDAALALDLFVAGVCGPALRASHLSARGR